MRGGFDFTSWTVEKITARLAALRKEKAAIEAEELALIAALDAARAYQGTGSTSTASMLAQEAQISGGSAKKMVDLANSLTDLPRLAEALATGDLSREVAGDLAKFATPETESELVEIAGAWSAGEARLAARRAKEITDAEQREINASCELRLRWSRDKTAMDLVGHFGAEGGAKLETTLERIAAQLPKEVGGKRIPFPSRMADALIALASTRISDDKDPDRATVSLHVDYEALVAGRGNAEIGGGYVSAEIARRIACDSRLEVVLDDPYGLCLGVGRTSRTIPAWLARQIRYRDKTCAYPGCERDFLLACD